MGKSPKVLVQILWLWLVLGVVDRWSLLALSAEIILLILNIGEIEMWLTLIAMEHLPCILNELDSMRLIIICVMKRSITERRRWSGYIDVLPNLNKGR